MSQRSRPQLDFFSAVLPISPPPTRPGAPRAPLPPRPALRVRPVLRLTRPDPASRCRTRPPQVIGVVGREKRLASDKTDRILLAEAIANMLVSFLYCSFGGVIYMLNVPYESRPSLPDITYYAFVTVTTVGYGDLTPSTDFEKARRGAPTLRTPARTHARHAACPARTRASCP